MRGEPARCQEVAEALPRIVDGTRRADRALSRHVERCLPCQAELARYRRMLRLLHQLREQRPPLPPGALDSMLAGIEARAGHHMVRSALGGRGRWVTGLVAAGALLAAGAAAVVATGLRDRRRGRSLPGTAAAAGAARIGALLTWPDGPSGYGPPAKATAAALRAAEGQ